MNNMLFELTEVYKVFLSSLPCGVVCLFPPTTDLGHYTYNQLFIHILHNNQGANQEEWGTDLL